VYAGVVRRSLLHPPFLDTAFGVLLAAREPHSFRSVPQRLLLRLIAVTHHGEDIMPKDSIRQLYIDELKDLYSAETQMVKALPKLAKASSSSELRQAFEEHLRQTSEQVSRLEQIFEMLDEKPTGKKCLGMEGLVKEGSEAMQESYTDAVKDAALIGAAQRVEHYEIAGYGTVRAFAELLGEDEHVSLIEETLEEEKQADLTLTKLAEQINSQAAESEEENPEPSKPSTRKTSSKRAA
jgi:ferritin-like metal-binding protein YciE